MWNIISDRELPAADAAGFQEGGMPMKKIVLTGGGTMGHVTPHLTLSPRLLEKGYEIHYVGSENGMEAGKMASMEGVT